MTPPRRATRRHPCPTCPQTQFLRLLAHELRNYIAPIHNAMHLLRLVLATTRRSPVVDIIERQRRE